MEPNLIGSGTFTLQDNEGGSMGLKTQYFPDRSAIIVTERSILLVERAAKYEINPSARKPE